MTALPSPSVLTVHRSTFRCGGISSKLPVDSP
jgi:hypothetical protein